MNQLDRKSLETDSMYRQRLEGLLRVTTNTQLREAISLQLRALSHIAQRNDENLRYLADLRRQVAEDTRRREEERRRSDTDDSIVSSMISTAFDSAFSAPDIAPSIDTTSFSGDGGSFGGGGADGGW